MAKKDPERRRYLRSATPERKTLPARLTPDNYNVLKSLSESSGQSLNSTLNDVVSAFAGYTQTPQPSSMTLQEFIADLNERRASESTEEEQSPDE